MVSGVRRPAHTAHPTVAVSPGTAAAIAVMPRSSSAVVVPKLSRAHGPKPCPKSRPARSANAGVGEEVLERLLREADVAEVDPGEVRRFRRRRSVPPEPRR